jgi:hypothetical protein
MDEPDRTRAWKLRLAVLASLLGVAAAPAPGALYAGPPTDPAFVAIAPRLLTALYPEQRLDATAVADSTAALEQVATNPASIAIAGLATMVAFAAANALPADRLEFHGPLEQHCLLAFARRDGWVRAFSDVTGANGSPLPVIGLAGPGAEPLLTILRRLEPGLTGIEAQPGDANTLAGQVARGSPDLLLLVAYPALDRALLAHLANDDGLTPLPVVTRLLSRAAFERDSGFTMQPVRINNGLAPWGRHKLVTLCTPVGVVLRNDAAPALRDAVNRALPIVAEALRPSLADRLGADANNALQGTLDAVEGLISRLRPN